MKNSFIQPSEMSDKKTKGAIVWDKDFDKDISKGKWIKDGVQVYNFGETPFYVKSSSPIIATSNILNSDVMKAVGIMNPPPIIFSKKQGLSQKPLLATQDVKSLGGIRCISASEMFAWTLYNMNLTKIKDPWVILKQDNVREFFLQYMTSECLDELINAFITTKLCTNPDFTLSNYLLYKRPNAKLYEGICAIDLEQSELFFYDQDNKGKSSFKDFISHKYKSALLTGGYGLPTSYSEKIQNLKDIIQSGKLSDGNIRTIKKVIRHDMAGRVARINKDIPLIRYKRAYDLTSALQQFNRNELSREL